MSYDLKLFTSYRSAIYSYATKTTSGYADIDFFNYERADWNQPTKVQPNGLGWYFNNGFENDTEGWTGRGGAKVDSNRQHMSATVLFTFHTERLHGTTHKNLSALPFSSPAMSTASVQMSSTHLAKLPIHSS